jgi:glycerol-3-phosphate dehydrogenase
VADLLGLDRNAGLPARTLPRARVLSAAAVLREVPGLAPEGLAGGVVWTDAQAETERLLMGFLHAASGAAACLANHVEVVGLTRGKGGPWQVRVLDRESGRELTVAARAVVNAAGPWLDTLLGRARLPPAAGSLVRATNLVLARAPRLQHVVGARSAGRFLFLAPWRDRAIVGTDYEPPETDPAAGARRFLVEAQAAFPWAGLRHEDVALVHRGLVPGTPARLCSRHRIVDHRATGAPGLFSIVAVKYTTARGVAEQVVDALGRWLGRKLPRCRTALTVLPGAAPLPGSLQEQARLAIREEMALHLDDVVLRRLLAGAAGLPPEGELATVAAVLARELGWDPARAGSEAARLAAAYNAAELS